MGYYYTTMHLVGYFTKNHVISAFAILVDNNYTPRAVMRG